MAREVRVLRCSNCGGSLPELTGSCIYCRATVPSQRCGECFHMNWLTAEHCSACGSQLGIEPLPELGSLACPSCASSFAGLPTETGGRILECEACRGHFVDHATLRALFERRARLCYRVDAPGSPARKATLDRVRYLPCPVCRESMNRRNFGERSGIIVDVCRAHGIWFDHDELPRVLSFVAQGGLEETTRRELEREREQLREQRQALVQAFAHPATQQRHELPDLTAGWLARVLEVLVDLVKPG